MNSLRRLSVLVALVGLLAAAATLAQPEPPQARANVACDVGDSIAGGVGPVAGAIGLGNPAAGVCDAVTSEVAGAVTKPITDAVKGLGNSVFEQVTTWTAEGATWLIGRVVAGIEKTTTPDLTSKGFLAQYARMAQIAALLGAAMLLFAILEAVAQNSWQVLGKAIFVNVPFAFIGTSVAFAVVQMLLLATDQMSHAVSVATHHRSEEFFKSAITGLGEAGAEAGGAASGATEGESQEIAGEALGGAAAPLFVTFLAAIIGAFAAFFVWIEMLMRDAAVYVVALFMPISMATFVSPRWSGILRRTCELLVVVIGSKFVIVSIIALAAALVSEDGAPVEHLLAAAALLLLSCFAPFVLMRFVLSTEGAMSAAYGRRSASGGAISGLQLASQANMVHRMARSNWSGGKAEPPEVWSVKSGSNGGSSGGGGGAAGGGAGAPKPGGGGGSAPAGAGGGGGAGAGGAGGAAAGAGAAAAVPGAAIRGAKSASQHLEGTAAAQSSGAGDSGARSGNSAPGVDSDSPGRKEGAGQPPEPAASPSAPHPAAEGAPRPPQDLDVKPPAGSEKT
jgi:type IV secretion system protein TrbL